MKKGKFVVTITIGVMCLILTMLIFMQVKTISTVDVSELEIMRESELKTEITTLKTKYEEVEAKIEETNSKILEYEQAITDGNEAAILQQKELKETEDLLGKNSVTGEGIVITLTNTGKSSVKASDLIELINILKDAGAEAISVNEQRLIYSSYIVTLNGTSYLSIDGNRIVAPFTVKAIGNTTYLESAIAQKKYGYVDKKIKEGKQVTLERLTSVIIPQFNGNLDFEYVREEE